MHRRPGFVWHISPKGVGLAGRPRDMSVEEEVLANIRSQRIGGHTVADLHLPDAFLRRIADRVIRESFWERHRVIVRDSGRPQVSVPQSVDPESGSALSIRVIVGNPLPPSCLRLAEARPAARGFRVNLAAMGEESPDEPGEPALRRGFEVIAHRLATDGVMPTLVRAIDAVGPAMILLSGQEGPRLLRRAGFPVDLLASFGDGDAAAMIGSTAERLSAGAPVADLIREARALLFRFRPSLSGFRAHSESGEAEPEILRVQLTGAEHWGGPGAGGSLDVLRQLLEALPAARFLIGVEERHLAGVLRRAADWPSSSAERATLLPQPLPVSQWAQDNAKLGAVHRGHAALLPRYASRGEEGALLVPGETVIAGGLSAAGMQIGHSPLHFQGGNLLLVTDPRNGDRILLIGEAEVYRNTSLGLTSEQAEDALRIELGADRSVVLPAASFHIDYEISVRAIGDSLVAFVNDTPAAVRLVLELGVTALISSGVVGRPQGLRALESLRAGRPMDFLGVVGPVVNGAMVGPGQFSERIAVGFSTGPSDLAAANLRVFLLAMDLLMADLASPTTLPHDRHLRSYFQSFRRRDADRKQLHRRLEALGMRLVKVPSFSDGAIGPNYVNGVQTRDSYLMPAWGGFLSPLDEAAAKAIRGAAQGLRIVPIYCAESQRRCGGVRCSVGVGFGESVRC